MARIERGGVSSACVFTGRLRELAAETVLLVTARLPQEALYRSLLARRGEWAAAGLALGHGHRRCLGPLDHRRRGPCRAALCRGLRGAPLPRRDALPARGHGACRGITWDSRALRPAAPMPYSALRLRLGGSGGMRRLFRAVGFVLIAVCLISTGRASTAPIHVTFLHFNDAYDIAPASGQGGWAEATTLIRRSRAKDINTIVTYGGDLISPSFISSMTQGAHMIALMNDIGVDYAIFGSHDFDFGPEVLKQRIAEFEVHLARHQYQGRRWQALRRRASHRAAPHRAGDHRLPRADLPRYRGRIEPGPAGEFPAARSCRGRRRSRRSGRPVSMSSWRSPIRASMPTRPWSKRCPASTWCWAATRRRPSPRSRTACRSCVPGPI